NSRNPNDQALTLQSRRSSPPHRQQPTSNHPEPRCAISSSRRHEPVATNGSSIGALQLPESRIEGKGFLVRQKQIS
ncbi:hypothetical protein LINPERHAP1_LOCUS8, partial [Linum perenne]